jgi:hypothetical protein
MLGCPSLPAFVLLTKMSDVHAVVPQVSCEGFPFADPVDRPESLSTMLFAAS